MATLSVAARNAALDSIATLLNGSSGPRLAIFNTSFGLMLNSNSPTPFGSASAGRVEVPATVDRTLTGSGTMFSMALATGGGTILVSAAIGLVGSGSEMEIDVLTAVSGQVIRFTTIALEIA
jgi:hypothetical protein